MVPMAMNGKIALVTGAGSGIGRASALALQSAGYSVALAGRRAVELERTIERASSAGGKMLAVPADIGQPQSVLELFDRVREAFGRLHVLFNSAVAERGEGRGGGGPEADGWKLVWPGRVARWVGDAIVCMADVRLGAKVQFVAVMATEGPVVGRG